MGQVHCGICEIGQLASWWSWGIYYLCQSAFISQFQNCRGQSLVVRYDIMDVSRDPDIQDLVHCFDRHLGRRREIYEYEYEYFIVIQDQYKIIGTTLTINRIYHSNSMHTYSIIYATSCYISLQWRHMSVMASKITDISRFIQLRSKKKSKPRITSPLWGESIFHQWIPLTKGQ